MQKTSHEGSKPAYLVLPAGGLLKKAHEAWEMLRGCRLCPRRCGADRTRGETGFCGVGDQPFVASWGAHFGEEPPLVGRRGSGTVFFAGCNLGCLYCQNWEISLLKGGAEVSFEVLTDIMLSLQAEGCHNINLVTPTHQMPMILRCVAIAAERGLRLPLVYNCGGYESPEALSVLDGVIDIYMPDFKYTDPEASAKFSDAPDYPEAAKAALKEMHRQVGDLVMDERGLALRGLLVRHLVLPGGLSGTAEAVRFIVEEISKDTYINIMDQYRPCFKAHEHPELSSRTSESEYREAVDLALKAGLRRLAGR